MNEEKKDMNGKSLFKGDIINLHQTVNGQNIFVVLNTSPLDIRYGDDLLREYEYDKIEMLTPSRFIGGVEWEIINNIYNLIPTISR